jgi:hypothetical protein
MDMNCCCACTCLRAFLIPTVFAQQGRRSGQFFYTIRTVFVEVRRTHDWGNVITDLCCSFFIIVRRSLIDDHDFFPQRFSYVHYYLQMDLAPVTSLNLD